MNRLPVTAFLIVIASLLFSACQPGATATVAPGDESVTTMALAAAQAPTETKAPTETEAPTATEAPPPTDTALPAPTEMPTSPPVATAAPQNYTVPAPTADCPIFEITYPEYEDQLKESPVPVLMYMFYEEDGPSRAIEPTVQKIANDYAGRIRVAKVDLDYNPVIAPTYGIQDYPGFVFTTGSDNVLGRVEGPMISETDITQMIDQQFATYPELAENQSTACITDSLINITDYNWDVELITSQDPILVYYWSSTDAASAAFLPKLRVLASELAGRIKIGADKDDESTVSGLYYGMGDQYPAFLLMRHGVELARSAGPKSKEEIIAFIDQYLP